ncbi:class I ribonucleotide reductase maintenance protein YfaE [Thalassotalea agarivorans]|uniref:Ferredoxin n=1 Tax=Thalassotalea agarivorans TaxID=349064 RepID=A0A1I0HA87_THASX|nr:class I ribonucleotide reductase maintenance protein YfaE [Thalassotalea agarivorans]SET80722.1 ferredoxin [Thalassotalea agarivorans]
MELPTSSAKDAQKDERKAVVIDGQKIPFTPEDKTLLVALEKHKIDAPYHCRDGFCGVCRATLKRGQVAYPNGEPLAYVGEGEILPCCCIPVTHIEIEIE